MLLGILFAGGHVETTQPPRHAARLASGRSNTTANEHNSGALIEVAKEGGAGGRHDLVYENIVNMVSRLQPVEEKSVCWIMNRDVIPQLYQMHLAVGSAGVAVFSPAEGTARPLSLMGYPIVFSEFSPTLGSANDLMLCDLSCYGWVDKPDAAVGSIHVEFLRDESCFRFVYQMDRMPLYAAPLTPAGERHDPEPLRGLGRKKLMPRYRPLRTLGRRGR